MPVHCRIFASLGLLALAGTACSDPTAGKPGGPTQAEVVSGDLQLATVGSALPQPLVVVVRDGRGKPVPGAAVSFVVTAGGGSVESGAVVSDAGGQARDSWTLGTVAGDTQRVEVRLAQGGQVLAVFRALAQPGAPATISPLSPTTVAGEPGLPLPDSLRVRVQDEYANAVPGATVLWNVVAGGGSISPASTTTRADGTAAAAWTLGSSVAGGQVAEAMAGLSTRTQFVAETGLPAAVAISKQTSDLVIPFSSLGGEHPTLWVRVTTPDGRPLAGVPVRFAQIEPDQPVDMQPHTLTTDAAGDAQIDWYIPRQAGIYRIAATVLERPQAQVVFAMERARGGTSAIGLVVLPRGGYMDITATPVDPLGQKLPGTVVYWDVQSGGGTVRPDSAPADANGEVHVVWTLGPSSLQTLRATVRPTIIGGSVPTGVNWDAEIPISLHQMHPDTIRRLPSEGRCQLPRCFYTALGGQSGTGLRSASVTAGGQSYDLSYQIGDWWSDFDFYLNWDFDYYGQPDGWKHLTWNLTDWLGRSVVVPDSVYWTTH